MNSTIVDAISTVTPLPVAGTFYYDSWDEVLHAELRFIVYKVDEHRPDTDIRIAFSKGDKEFAKYVGGSNGIQGGNGSFKWVE